MQLDALIRANPQPANNPKTIRRRLVLSTPHPYCNAPSIPHGVTSNTPVANGLAASSARPPVLTTIIPRMIAVHRQQSGKHIPQTTGARSARRLQTGSTNRCCQRIVATCMSLRMPVPHDLTIHIVHRLVSIPEDCQCHNDQDAATAHSPRIGVSPFIEDAFRFEFRVPRHRS